MTGQLALRPYDPAHPCPICGAENGRPIHHALPILVAFSGPRWACLQLPDRTDITSHFCNKCEICGFAWMEKTPDMAQE